MKYKLSILICTLPSRAAMLGRLKSELWSQMLPFAPEVEIRVHDSSAYPIGRKRNDLLQAALGEYVAFVDDDDEIAPNYISVLMQATETGCDCASLKGMYYVDGKENGIFEHSIKYSKWETTNGKIKYLRFPNHLNMIKASIAKQFIFPEKNHGEDFDWSQNIHRAKVLQTEYYIPEIIYHYKFISKKPSHVFTE